MGKGWWQAPTYELSFCCNSGSNGKTQPYYWLGTDHNNNDNTKKQRQKGKRKNKRKTRKDYEQVGLQEAPHLQDPKQKMSTDTYLKVDLLWLNSDSPFFLSRKKTHHIRLTPRISLLPFSIFNFLILEITYQSWTFSLGSQFLTTPKDWWESPLGFQQLQQTMKLNSSRDWSKSLSCTYCRWCAL